MLFLQKLWFLLLTLSAVGICITTTTSITPTNMLTATNTTKPGCPRKCGNLTIPYPFGIGSNCSINYYFTVICNASYSPPRAFTMLDLGFNRDAAIVEITETQLLLQNSRLASKCYDSQGNVTSESTINFDIVDSPFTFSNGSNKLTVVGCDDYALISGYTGILANGGRHEYNSVGCLALCSSQNELIPGSCSGLGCCQTSIPVGLQSFMITLSSLNNHTAPTTRFQPCAYAFLSGSNGFTFRGASDFAPDDSLINRTKDQVPMVLDWFVGDFNFSTNTSPTCDQAKKNSTSYACQLNTECIDVVGGGYHCKCKSGYEGNPYLKPGCTDFNECAAASSNLCSMICVNTVGSYNCSCPRGFYGDGYNNNGTAGCTKIVDYSSSSLKKLTLGLSISLGTILLILCGWGSYALIRRRIIMKQKARHFERNGGLILQQQMSYDESVVARLKIFTANELDRATDHFNEDRILGKGGQGTVYKGMLSEGKIVAIKKSKIMGEKQMVEFINEVVIVSQINHRNIVKLLGCCLETEVPLLVYEFVPNGTLFHHIHHPNEEFPITWRMRLQVASDSAGALAYLHSSSSTPILHRDIKSSNILLDDKYKAKLSDFGTSRSIALDQTHVTTRVVGTFGYLDPEYFKSSQFTEKSDVYSFGVVLVELLTGQKAIRSSSEEDRSLTSWFISHMENSLLLDIIDTQLLEEGSKEEFHIVANLAKRCINMEGRNRPTMKEVLVEIEAVLSLHIPQQNCPDTQQVVTNMEAAKHTYDGVSYSGTYYIENNSLNSAELSLLFNPR